MQNSSVERIAVFLNEQAADIHVFRLILQIFLRRFLTSNPLQKELFAILREELLATIDNTSPVASDPDGSERRKQLERFRADEFFDELGEALGIEAKPPAIGH